MGIGSLIKKAWFAVKKTKDDGASASVDADLVEPVLERDLSDREAIAQASKVAALSKQPAVPKGMENAGMLTGADQVLNNIPEPVDANEEEDEEEEMRLKPQLAVPVKQMNPVPRLTIVVITGLAAFLLLKGIREVNSWVAPTFFALNLMIVAYPLHRWLVKHKVPGFLASFIAGISILTVLLAIIFGLIWSVAMMVMEIPNYSDQFTGLYQQIVDWMGKFGFSEQDLMERLRENLRPENVVGVIRSLAAAILTSAGGIASVFTVMVMAIFFLMMDTPSMHRRMEMIRDKHQRFTKGVESFTSGVRSYWIVTTVFGLIVAVLDGVVLFALGVPLALVWTLFSFLTNYVPNIGFFIGLFPPALLALVDGGPVPAIIVVVAYCVLNFVVQSIIQPRFTGDAVGVTPTISFLSLLVWGWVLGGMGALLALPCTLLVKAMLVDADPKARWVNALIASDPDTANEIHDGDDDD